MISWFQYTTFHLGPIPIQIWGLFVAAGILFSILIIWKTAEAYKFDKDKILDLVLWMIVFGFIFARIFHIIFYEFGHYFNNPIEIIKIWHGGFSSFGGFLGAGIALCWFLKRGVLRKEKLAELVNFLALPTLVGWIIARLGCFMIHDHLGRLSNFFLAIDTPFGGPRLEMALLEIILLLPLLITFIVQKKKWQKKQILFPILLIYYGLLRLILDFFRATDIAQADARFFGLTPGQYFGIVMAVWGVMSFRGALATRNLSKPKT